ncbi:MAG: hypothetical protein WBC51_27650 [Vicinamibacterales bacterium]
MSVMRLIAPAVICAAVAAPVSADVTLRMTMVESEIGRVTSVTEYRKGLKMRTDSSGDAITSNSMILNLETGLVIMLWHDGKRADVIDVSRMAAPLGKNEVTQSITPTTQSRQIAGSTCTVYNVRSSLRMKDRMMEMAEPIAMVMEGSMCLVKNAPGQADFARLSRAMAERAVAANPQSAILRQIAELGVPYATELTFSLGANLPGAAMHTIGTHTTEVNSVSTDPIPDALFEIPAGYTVTKR